MQTSEFTNVSAGIGGGFKNTKDLKVMNYKEAVNGPDGVRWQAEVENEYQQMVENGVAQGFASGHKDYRQHLGDENEEQWYAAWAHGCKRIQVGRRIALQWHNNQLTSHKLSNY